MLDTRKNNLYVAATALYMALIIILLVVIVFKLDAIRQGVAIGIQIGNQLLSTFAGRPAGTASTFVGGREHFSSPSYMEELKLFRSMNPSEQGEYLKLSKSAKVAKYGTIA